MRTKLMLVVLAGVTAWSAAEDNIIRNGNFELGTQYWTVPGQAAIIPCDLPGHAKALRLTLSPEPGSAPWAITMSQGLSAFLREGDRLVLKLWMRSAQGCKVGLHVEQAGEPYAKSLSGVLETTPEWKQYTVEGKSDRAFSPNASHLVLHLAYTVGSLEMTGIELTSPDLSARPGGKRASMDDPQSLINNGDFTESLEGNWGHGDGERLRTEVVDAEVGEYKKALRLHCRPPEDSQPWSVGFGQTCTGAVYPGDAVYFRAWMRSPDNCKVGFVYEMARPPHTKTIMQYVTLSPEWKEYRFMGRPEQGFQPGESQAKWFLGMGAGVIEVAGVRVDNCGDAPDTAFHQTIDYWAGREHPDDWRAAALERIERIRKGDVVVRVVDQEGNLVHGAQVAVTQKRHGFRFGTALPAARLVDSTNPDNARFREEVERLYNTVTFENDLKWAAMSKGTLQNVDAATEWLTERGIEVRGHCLLWGSYQHLHQASRDLRGEDLLRACRDHVTEYATRMKDRLYLWDVVNEAATNTELWDEVGWEAFADSFRWAREADPGALLCYNDYGIVNENPPHREKVAKRVQYLLDHGAPVDVLGIQAHMFTPLTPIHRVLEILDEWAAFGLPLEITEFDLGCADDQIHADYVRDFMLAMFSHPRVQAFIMWGFWEGSHWRSKDQGAMFRRDWSKRPAQEAWEQLVLRDWWTNWQGTTDADGAASLRAFYGTHELIAKAGDRTGRAVLHLSPGPTAQVQVTLE